MKLRTILLATLTIAFAALAIWNFSQQSTAQEPAAEASDLSPEADEDDDSHRRLPPYYGDLVTPGQRTKIYTIQDKYEDRIEELKAQLRAVVAERDKEIESVLEPEQRELLTVLRDQAKLLREARAKAAARLKESLPEDESP